MSKIINASEMNIRPLLGNDNKHNIYLVNNKTYSKPNHRTHVASQKIKMLIVI